MNTFKDLSATPSFAHEDSHPGIIAGVDEAGRGPWAGPVIAAAVILDRSKAPPINLNDSKKLKPSQRETLFNYLTTHAWVGIGEASVAEIDTLNILRANDLAMARALKALPIVPTFALVDGNRTPPNLEIPAKAIIKGDAKSCSIAAASIVAKVTRDRIMQRLSMAHPEYGWHTNQGYGTPLHARALHEYGLTPHHRTSFKPVRAALE